MIVQAAPTLSVDDQLDHVRLEAEVERSTGSAAERLSWRLALDVVLFLRRHPEADWGTVRDAMDRVSDLVRNARNRNRACHWSPRRNTPAEASPMCPKTLRPKTKPKPPPPPPPPPPE